MPPFLCVSQEMLSCWALQKLRFFLLLQDDSGKVVERAEATLALCPPVLQDPSPSQPWNTEASLEVPRPG